MDSLSQLYSEMRGCRLCLDAGHAIVPGAVVRGGAEAQVMLIGQAPGVTEVEAKRPFNAGSGKRLFKWLGEAGWDEDQFRRRHYMTAVTKCYPGKGGIHAVGKGDRVPSKAEQALCRPFLEQEISLVRPKLMILVGGLAIKLLFPAKARLADVVGTAVYFPPETLNNPVNFNLDDALSVQVSGNRLTVNGLPLTDYRSLNTGFANGRIVVPLPHPSGASLWPNKPANKLLISKAIQILQIVRHMWQL